jgi:dGTPase
MKGIVISSPTDLPPLKINQHIADEIRILKQITRNFIEENTALGAQQHGQERIITELFEDLYKDITSGELRIVPKRFQYLVRENGQFSPRVTTSRLVADCISGLTEAEATALYRRLRGQMSFSVLDPIVR